MTRRIRPVVLNPRAIAATSTESFAGATTGGDVTWKTLLSSTTTPSNTFTSGIAKCAPKGGHLKCHRHTQPEMYHVIQGRGSVSIDEKEYEVEKGSVVFIPGDSEHGIRNNAEEEDLVWLYVFATDKFEDVIYRFSNDMPRGKI